MGNCVGNLSSRDKETVELTPFIPWRKSRYLPEDANGQERTLAGPIKLRSLLRNPDSPKTAASVLKYKDKTVDWISDHYRTRLSVHKGEYKLEAELAQTIVGDFCEAGWKVVLYEYKLHRWDGDLIFVKNEDEEQPMVLVVEAKVLTGVYHDKTKFDKVVQQADTYWYLARSLFHQNCKVYSLAVINIRLHAEYDRYKDRLFIAKRAGQRISEELVGLLPVEDVVNNLAALHEILPVLKDYVPPKQETQEDAKRKPEAKQSSPEDSVGLIHQRAKRTEST